MNTQPTPETDAESFSTAYQGELVYASFARKLEIERDEARFDLDFRRRLGDLQNKTIDDLTAQRDRLAESLRHTVRRINHYEEYKTGNRLFPPDVNAALDFANKALQSLTPSP
jgi:hypothetical protein